MVKADAASPKLVTTTGMRRAARPKLPQQKQPTSSKPKPATPAPRVQGKTRKRRLREPRPVFPKVGNGKRERKPALRWWTLWPRLLGRN